MNEISQRAVDKCSATESYRKRERSGGSGGARVDADGEPSWQVSCCSLYGSTRRHLYAPNSGLKDIQTSKARLNESKHTNFKMFRESETGSLIRRNTTKSRNTSPWKNYSYSPLHSIEACGAFLLIAPEKQLAHALNCHASRIACLAGEHRRESARLRVSSSELLATLRLPLALPLALHLVPFGLHTRAAEPSRRRPRISTSSGSAWPRRRAVDTTTARVADMRCEAELANRRVRPAPRVCVCVVRLRLRFSSHSRACLLASTVLVLLVYGDLASAHVRLASRGRSSRGRPIRRFESLRSADPTLGAFVCKSE